MVVIQLVLLLQTASCFIVHQTQKTSHQEIKGRRRRCLGERRVQHVEAKHTEEDEALSSPLSSPLSSLALSIAPSKTIEMHALTMELLDQGEAVSSLSVGEPDFRPPEAGVAATAEAAREGRTRYTEVTGTKELRTKIAEYLDRKKGTPYDPRDIVVTNGAKQAVYEAVLAVCGPGDEVLIPTPYWVSYPEIVKMAGATPVLVPTNLDDGYKLQAADVEKAVTEKTKMLVLCNPCNPTGACLDKDELAAIDNVLPPKVWVLADEIYERLYYNDDDSHVSFAGLSEATKCRTIVINGFSKAYAMTGFRLGYLAAPPTVARAAAKIQGQITSCASSISQAAGVAALDLPDDALDSEVAEFKRRRDFVLHRLRAMAEKTHRISPPPEPPGGAFYVLPEVHACFGLEAMGRIISDSSSFCAALLANRKLALVPGDAFGAPNAIRISYAASQDTLDKAMDALEAFLSEDLVLREDRVDDDVTTSSKVA